MLHSYEEARDWIHNQLPVGIKPGLKRMEWMMEQLNHSERRIRTIHIGGTNGKGSTVSYLRNILQESGMTVGTFTSPYIEHFNERIAINGIPISDDEFLQAANQIKPLTEKLKDTELGCPTEFEVITAISILYFATMNYPDIVLYEVGLGGRFDSTNVIYPLLSIITNIGYDHMSFLGNSICEIAFEKAGIIKQGIPIITASENDEVYHIFHEIAKEKKAKLYKIDQDFSYTDYLPTEHGGTFSFHSTFVEYDELEIKLMGEHQAKNAALAIHAINYLQKYYSFIVEEKDIRNGLLRTTWIGRFEKIRENPLIIIDGAHNIEGIQSLTKTLKHYFSDKNIRIIFSALKDKPVRRMISELTNHVSHIMFTSFAFPRAQKAVELAKETTFPTIDWKETFEDAIEIELRRMNSEEDVLVITGSLYFISDVRKYLIKE